MINLKVIVSEPLIMDMTGPPPVLIVEPMPKMALPAANFNMICEGEKGWLECKQYEIIRITDVFWGREPHDYETCSKPLPGLTIDRSCETVSIS